MSSVGSLLVNSEMQDCCRWHALLQLFHLFFLRGEDGRFDGLAVEIEGEIVSQKSARTCISNKLVHIKNIFADSLASFFDMFVLLSLVGP